MNVQSSILYSDTITTIEEFMNTEWQITNDDVFTGSYGISTHESCIPYGEYFNTFTYVQRHCCDKSSREKVQDEILTKMAEAIEKNDLMKARQLVDLAKALKEL